MPENPESPYRDFTRTQLVDLATKAGVHVPARATKAQIEELLEEHYTRSAEAVIAEVHAPATATAQGRPLWESGETYQAFQQRLAEWKASRAAHPSNPDPFPSGDAA